MQYMLTEEEYQEFMHYKDQYNSQRETARKHINLLIEHNTLKLEHLALKASYQELVEKYDITLEDKIQNILFEEFKKTLIPELELHKAILEGKPIQRCLKPNSKLMPDTTHGRIPIPLMYETYDIANSEDPFLDYDNYDYRVEPEHNEGYLKQVDCSLYNTSQRGV